MKKGVGVYGLSAHDYVMAVLEEVKEKSDFDDGAVKVSDLIASCGLVSSSTVRRVLHAAVALGQVELSSAYDARGMKQAQYVRLTMHEAF